MRDPYHVVTAELALLDRLAAFDPVLIGTPPLDIDTSSSDIDCACFATDPGVFVETVTSAYGQLPGFRLKTLAHLPAQALTVCFDYAGWGIELFAQALPVSEQWGVRHFLVEERLLALAPELRGAVRELKHAGLRTEPAFAQLLGLGGDPYQAVLALEHCSEAQLRELVAPLQRRPAP